MSRFGDWLEQAKRDLEAARWAMDGGFWDVAAFYAHQAAELAARAVFVARKDERKGHAVSLLLGELGAPEALVEAAQELDHHYIGARYPDVYAMGAPMKFYNKKLAERMVGCAEKVIAFAEEKIQALPLIENYKEAKEGSQ